MCGRGSGGLTVGILYHRRGTDDEDDEDDAEGWPKKDVGRRMQDQTTKSKLMHTNKNEKWQAEKSRERGEQTATAHTQSLSSPLHMCALLAEGADLWAGWKEGI